MTALQTQHTEAMPALKVLIEQNSSKPYPSPADLGLGV